MRCIQFCAHFPPIIHSFVKCGIANAPAVRRSRVLWQEVKLRKRREKAQQKQAYQNAPLGFSPKYSCSSVRTYYYTRRYVLCNQSERLSWVLPTCM